MHILIDALPVTNASGTGYYVQKLVEALARLAPDHDCTAVTPPVNRTVFDDPAWPGKGRVQALSLAPRRPALQALWRQYLFAGVARRLRVDLVHYPAFLGCLRCDLPSVVTIPDLVWRSHRETVPPRKRRYYDRVIGDTMARAARIITISDATRAELTEHFPQHANKTTTVHLGVDRTVFRPLDDATDLARVRSAYKLPEVFILALSTLEPRKNLSHLIRAFELVAPDAPEVSLVLAGKAGYEADRLRAQAKASAVGERIVFPGHIAAADLPLLYNLATLFAFPSLSEGFGLPILEAMACGVPVLTGNRSAMREVAGDAAELVDPVTPEAIADGLRRLLHDASRRSACVDRGRVRAEAVPWERTAAETLRIYEAAVA